MNGDHLADAPQRTTRRALLWKAARAGLGGLTAAAAPAPLFAGDFDLPARLFRDRESARRIGQRYLRTKPAPSELEALQRTLRREANPRPWLRARIAADFAAGRVVVLDGWVLAVTEARLCALAAMA